MISNFVSACRAFLNTSSGLYFGLLSRSTAFLGLLKGIEQFFIAKRLLQQGQNIGLPTVKIHAQAMVDFLCYLQTKQDDRQRLVGRLKLIEPSQFFFSESRVDVENHGACRTNVLSFVFQRVHDDHLIPALSEYFFENIR